MTTPENAGREALGDIYPTRYYVMVALREHVSLTLADLADEVAVREHDRPLSDVSPDVVLEHYDDLYDVHVPALVDVGVVAYDQERDVVALDGYGPQQTALDESHLLSYRPSRPTEERGDP
ncbi:DUF7344 domain-containing protein [Halomarina pelagica]|uniref:DUF7344 domain-containing protein n=1 Tax=Halomarina pelagica TaxID=2961599 RepID=UPI0020C4FF13|nr:hypothetical protein [Halomarina sp. BND7]